MKRKKIILSLTITILICTSVIALSTYFLPNDYKTLFVKVKNKSAENTNRQVDLSEYMYDYNEDELGISENNLSYITSILDKDKIFSHNELTELNKVDAISDVNLLFNLLKYSYAGYSYFGGDDTFENAKENIINSINSYPKEKIDSDKVENIITINTDFIQDGHFIINNKSPLKHYSYYSSEDICVNKSSKGYYINENYDKWYIKTINGSYDFDDYLKLSINSNGELCYYIGILDNSNNPTKVKVILQSKNEEIEKDIQLKKNNYKTACSNNDRIGYEYSEKNSIPIVTMGRMYDVDPDDKSTELFSKSAINLKDKPIIILDIRGNYGGQDIGPMNWFKNFTGEMPQTESESIQLCSLLNNYISKIAMKNIDYETLDIELKEEYEKEVENANSYINKWYVSKTEEKLHKNDTKIFVLIDDKVASSGENFIGYLNTLENVIVVGTNTSGTMVSNLYIKSQLPNSNINVNWGNTLTLNKGFTEGKGFEPDIWIDSNDSLDRVLKLINRIN